MIRKVREAVAVLPENQKLASALLDIVIKILIGLIAISVLSGCATSSAGHSVTKRYPDGTIKEKGRIIQTQSGDFVKEGSWKSWYRNGNLKSVGFYDNGRLEGRHKGWHINGTKSFEGTYRDNMPVNEWTFWSKNGIIDRQKTFM